MNQNNNGFYSQWGQDEFVVSVLKNKKSGYFVDIGAYDGVTISNTYYLEKELEWKGLCLEANPYTYESLISSRKSKCVNLAIAPYNGEVEILLNGWSSAINDDFTSSEIIKQGFNSVKVNAITINDLFEKYEVPESFDYLSIDVEGGELEIISQLDFKRWRPSLITYEHNCHLFDHPDHKLLIERQQQVESILFGNDYKLYKNFNGDGFFVDKNLIP